MAASLRRSLRSAAFRLLLPPVGALLAPLPFRAVLAWGRAVARLLWLVNGRERRRMLAHLALAFPELPADDRRRLARASALHHGMSLAENLHVLWRGPRRILPRIAVEGWENVASLRTAGRRILLVMGHCGNWELPAAVLPARGLPVLALGRGMDDPALRNAVLRLRARLGAGTIVRGATGSAGQLRRALRGEVALALFIDQDTRVEGVWVPFFGRPAYTPVAAAQLALEHGMAAVPAFMERLADGTHRCRFLPALDLPADPIAATACMTACIEAQIRRRPEQWVWMHRRWRRQPEDRQPPSDAPASRA